MNNLDENIENKNSEKKEIKIVSGDGDGLNISPFREHINIEKPHEKPNKAPTPTPADTK